MSRHRLNVNGEAQSVEADPAMPLLWVLRDALGATGTKFGCGVGACGVCLVLVDGVPTRSCLLPVGGATSARITTIEGLAGKDDRLTAVQQAWLDEDVAQCGYCQPAMILRAMALLAERPEPTDADIDGAMNEVVCRCGTYVRVRRAVHRAAAALRGGRGSR